MMESVLKIKLQKILIHKILAKLQNIQFYAFNSSHIPLSYTKKRISKLFFSVDGREMNEISIGDEQGP